MIGKDVAGTVTAMSAEMPGVPPGSLIRRRINRPNTALLTPMKYPSFAAGS